MPGLGISPLFGQSRVSYIPLVAVMISNTLRVPAPPYHDTSKKGLVGALTCVFWIRRSM